MQDGSEKIGEMAIQDTWMRKFGTAGQFDRHSAVYIYIYIYMYIVELTYKYYSIT